MKAVGTCESKPTSLRIHRSQGQCLSYLWVTMTPSCRKKAGAICRTAKRTPRLGFGEACKSTHTWVALGVSLDATPRPPRQVSKEGIVRACGSDNVNLCLELSCMKITRVPSLLPFESPANCIALKPESYSGILGAVVQSPDWFIG